MVRGWNDPGSRISVRFADTSEQRELRRQERTVRGGEESSPARLTIAQAALLNLRGRDQIRAQSIPVIGSRGRDAGAPTANQAYDDFSSNAHGSAGAYRGGGDFPHQTGRRTLAQTAPYDQPISLPPPASLLQNTQNINPAMAAILGTLRGNGVPFNADINDAYGDVYNDGLLQLDHQGGYHQRQQLSGLRNQVLGDVDLNQLGYSHDSQYHRTGGVAQARGGYTAAEEYILQAHASTARRRAGNRDVQQQQFCHPEAITDPAVADFNVGVGVRGYRTQASTISLPQSSYGAGGLSAVMEDDGQALSSTPLTYSRSQILSIGNRMGVIGRGRSDSSSTQQGSSQTQLHQQYGSPTTQSQAQFSSNRNLNDHSQAHVRSTTLPSSATTPQQQQQQQRHVQHSSMSIPKSRNLITDIMRTNATTLPQQKHSTNSSSSIISADSLAKGNGNGLYNNTNETSDVHTNGSSAYTSEVASHLRNGTVHYYHGKQNNFDLYTNTQPRQQAKNLGQEFHHHQQSQNQKSFRREGLASKYGAGSADVPESGSPPLVSPALTYSSRGSAGTLSPSTPFVGTFSQAPGSGRTLEADA
ncbi:hypothetical protein V5O48_012787 [Marasmius crinis-equi]|uniref:Uncharacterized protein n=1 Tax=Marasmius crinis-equi TaxID=585013 RepID=A0ABR3F1W2_9AGAR